ncbi:MAG: Rrf2 family transcriptional regulator [Planctomycetes bacterium]|nr:Rrf2 family transcriptional regulator [Planctomycetota bacterium]
MKISAKIEYACLAMLELASRYDADEPARNCQIAAAHDIPSRFLVQILLQLKSAGLVISTRGASGGYRLARPPQEITLGEVMGVIGGSGLTLTIDSDDDSATAKVLCETWSEIHNMQQDMLDSTTLADLVQRAKGYAEHMYYI